jgi:hypothetical protein
MERLWEKTDIYLFMNASENENISALFFWENFLNILCSVICQNKWVD